MVEASRTAFRLLRLIALLFPVVTLLLQLQHRAAESVELERVGVKFGTGLSILLAFTFVASILQLFVVESLSLLAIFTLFGLALISLLFPVLLLFASEQAVDEVRTACATLLEASESTWRRAFGTWARNRSDEDQNADDGSANDETND